MFLCHSLRQHPLLSFTVIAKSTVLYHEVFFSYSETLTTRIARGIENYKKKLATFQLRALLLNGADDENRTDVVSLEG